MTFEYEALPDKSWIRLIKIQAKLQQGRIACSLQQFSSNTCPVYKALSYLWGDPTARHTIIVNETSRRIHQNLWQYLYQAWLSREPAFLWIDSLCLDQSNHAEKNEQVPLMGDIFASAETVIAWIGCDEAGMEMLRFYSRRWSPKQVQQSFASLQVRTQATMALFRLLITEVYWTRVWVIQEILCAKDCLVVCGTVSVQWAKLVHNVTNTIPGITKDQATALGWKSQQFFALADLRTRLRRGHTLTLLQICDKLRTRECGRSVDLIYGLLGVAHRFNPRFNPQSLDVNYEKPLGHVFWDTVLSTWETCRKAERPPFLATLPDFVGLVSSTMNLGNRALGSYGRRNIISELGSFARASTTRKGRQRIAHTALQTLRAFEGGFTFLNEPLQAPVAELVSHACTHLPPMESRSAQIVCGRIIGLAVLKMNYDGIEERDVKILEFNGSPLVCAAHLPANLLARRVPLNQERLSNPVKSSKENRTCSRSAIASECDFSFSVLEWPELGLDLQLTRRLDTEGPPPLYSYWRDIFCTFCNGHLQIPGFVCRLPKDFASTT